MEKTGKQIDQLKQLRSDLQELQRRQAELLQLVERLIQAEANKEARKLLGAG